MRPVCAFPVATGLVMAGIPDLAMWGAQGAGFGARPRSVPTARRGEAGASPASAANLDFFEIGPRPFWSFGTRSHQTGGPAVGSRFRGLRVGVQLEAAGTHVELVRSCPPTLVITGLSHGAACLAGAVILCNLPIFGHAGSRWVGGFTVQTPCSRPAGSLISFAFLPQTA